MRHTTRKRSAGVVGVMILPLALTRSSLREQQQEHGLAQQRHVARRPGGGTVTIGFQGPLSGPNSPQLGINGLDGVKLAVKQANDAHALPYTLKLEQSDDQGTPDQGPDGRPQARRRQGARGHRPDVLGRDQGLRAGFQPGRHPVGQPLGDEPGPHHAGLQDVLPRDRSRTPSRARRPRTTSSRA